jgi:phenylacetate-CoA ligase
MKLYNYLLENIILNFFGWMLQDSFVKELKKLRVLILNSESDLVKIQNKKLENLLKYSRNNVNFYKNLNLKKNEELDIKSYPIINKEILRKKKHLLFSNKVSKSSLVKHVSSGSSGVQSVVYWTKKEQSIHRATQILWWEWAGYQIGQPILQTGINPKRTSIKKIKDFLFRTNYVQAFTHSPKDLLKSLKWSKNKNIFFAGYASSLYVYSQFAKQNKIKVNFKGAVSWGDKLFDHYKKNIKKEFGVDVKETYGSAEGLMMAAQYDLNYMYLMSPNVYIEILDDYGNEVPDGEMGNVIVTNLNAYGMPLIRYKIGDLAIKLAQKDYPVNRKLKLPILKKIIGRDTDIIKTKSGKYLVVHSFTGVFEHYKEIIQFCVIQNNLESIKIQIITAEAFNSKILEKIKKDLNKYINGELLIKFEKVYSIEPTPSGKPQIIISNL